MPRSAAARKTTSPSAPRRSPRSTDSATRRRPTRSTKKTAAKATTKATDKTTDKAEKTAEKTAEKATTKAAAKKPVASKAAKPRKAATIRDVVTKAKPTTPSSSTETAPKAAPPTHTVLQATLTEEELTAIWKTYKRTNDQNLRNILVEHHMQLVRMIAERVLQTLPKSIELDDLTSAGTFGLMDAIDGFDLSRGIKFKTYCTTRIRGSILDELRSQDWVPRLVRIKAHRIEKSLRKLEGELGRLPNTVELAEAMNLSIAELQDTQDEANAKTIFSLSEKWDDGDDDKEMEKVDILADRRSPDPHDSTAESDVMDTVTRNLTKKERLIIIMYYYEGLTMREIGEIMELTESRVCQIHSNVMSRLKGQLDRVALLAH